MGITSVAIFGAMTLATLAMFSTAAQAGDAGRAKRDLMFARDAAESGKWDDLDTNMKKAAADMEGLSDADKAPFLTEVTAIKGIVTKSIEEEVTKRLDKAAKADGGSGKFDIDRATMRLDSDEAKAYADPALIAKLRARIASMTGAPAPAPSTPTPAPTTPANTNTPPMSGDLAAAASRVRSARGMLEGGDPQIAQSQIAQAMRLLANIPDGDKAPVLADIVALNKDIDAYELKKQREEELRRVDEQVSRYVGDAENMNNGVVNDFSRLDRAQKLLDGTDAKLYMDAPRIKGYQDRVDAMRVKLKAYNKQISLERCAGNLKELEQTVAGDPFKGQGDNEGYKVFSTIDSLSWRVRKEFDGVDKNDPDIKAVLDRVDAANAKVQAAAGKWAVQNDEKRFVESWKFNSQGFAGWESEQLVPQSIGQRRVEGLGKTSQAITGTVYWLNNSDTKQMLGKYKDNATIAATAQEAHKTLESASAKLNDAFNAVVADAEKQPMPTREADRAQIEILAHDAGRWFEGTQYKDPNVARASALDAKWKAEVARAEKEMEAWLTKATADANAAWPKIELAVGPDKSFDSKDADNWKGKTVEIRGYYNRSGWDFDAAYDFAATIKGVPVAGRYDPNVAAAFSEASSHTKFGINDHIDWDVIAVVEGRGQINRRVTVELRDKDTHELIMKTEKLVPEPCVVLKIIGLHAGPLAVGPK